MIFYKTVSAGNDFIHLELSGNDLKDYNQKSSFAKIICCRKWGVGADGIVYYSIGDNSVDFQIFNQDGNEAELSGNGMAGLSSILFNLKHFKDNIIINTLVGKRVVYLKSRSENKFKVNVEIGEPDFKNKAFFPFIKHNQIKYEFQNISYYPVSVGNPHVVVFFNGKFSDKKLLLIGEKFGKASIFPQGTNVDLVKKNKKKQYQVFFYERGVGQTFSSSTGAAAVFAVMQRLKRIQNSLQIKTPFQKINITGSKKIYVENLCEIVYKGIYFK